MGSDNEYEHQSEWRKTGGISIRQSSEFFQIPNKPIEISISELQVSKHGSLYIVSNMPQDYSWKTIKGLSGNDVNLFIDTKLETTKKNKI